MDIGQGMNGSAPGEKIKCLPNLEKRRKRVVRRRRTSSLQKPGKPGETSDDVLTFSLYGHERERGGGGNEASPCRFTLLISSGR